MPSLSELLQTVKKELAVKSSDLQKCNELLKEIWGICNNKPKVMENVQTLTSGNLVQSLKTFYALTIPKFFGPSKKAEPPERFLRTMLLGTALTGSRALARDMITAGLTKDILKYLDENLTGCTNRSHALDRPGDSYQYVYSTIIMLTDISHKHDSRNEYKAGNAVKILLKYRQTDDTHPLYAQLEGFIAQLADVNEIEELFRGDTYITVALDYTRKIIKSPEKKVKVGLSNYIIGTFVAGINQLLLNEAKRKVLVEKGIIDVYAEAIRVSLSLLLFICKAAPK